MLGSLFNSLNRGGGGASSNDAGGGGSEIPAPMTTLTQMDATSRELLNVLRAKIYQLVVRKETDWTIMSTEEANRLNEKINELKTFQNTLTNEIEAARNKRKMTAREIQDFGEKINEIKTKLVSLENLPVTEREYVEAKEKLQKYIQDLQNKEQQKNNLNETLTTLQRRIADAESNIQTKQTEISDIQNRLNNKDQSVQERNTLKEALKKAQENLQEQKKLHQQQIDAKKEAQEIIERINTHNQQLAQRIQNLSPLEDLSSLEAQEKAKYAELDQIQKEQILQRKNVLKGERQHVINLSNNVRTNREQLESFKQSLPQLAQMYNEAINELPRIQDAHYEINGPHRSFANQTRAKDVRNKFIQLKNAFEPFKNIIDPGIDFDHLIAAANSGIPDDSGALGPESLQYPKLRVRGDYPNSMHPDGYPVNRYYRDTLGEKGSIHEFRDRLNNLNFEDRINQLRQEEQQYQQQIDTYDQKISHPTNSERLTRGELFDQKRKELTAILEKKYQTYKQIYERDQAQKEYDEISKLKNDYLNKISKIETTIAEKQAQEQQINNTIRENQERLRRTDWLEQEGIDPQIIRNNITAAEQELARMAQEKEALNQQLNTTRQNLSATEQEIAAIQRDQSINKPQYEKTIERHDLPPELEKQKKEAEKRVKELQRQLEDIPHDGSPETLQKIKVLTDEVNEIQASYALSAPLNKYHDKAAQIVEEYTKSFFPEHQKLNMRMDEIEKKPRLEEILKPFLGKLSRDTLDDVDKFRDRLNEETIYEGLMKDHLKRYGYEKNLIDNQFSKIGAGNSAAHHFAKRQHAAMTDYLLRKEKAKMNQENFQKSFQHVLADRNATTNVVNNLTQAHMAQGNIDAQNLNMRAQGLQKYGQDARDVSALNNQLGNLYHQYGQNSLDRNYQHRLRSKLAEEEKLFRAGALAAGLPVTSQMQTQYTHAPNASFSPPIQGITPAIINNLGGGLNDILINQQRPQMAHGGFLQKLAKGGKVNPQPEPFTPLPYTNEMIQRANYLENARQDSNADAYANMLSAWTSSPQTPTMNRIGQAILKTHQNKRDDYEKHLGRVGASTEIYGTLQKQQQRQAEFLKSHNLDERKLAEQIRHNKASEGIMSAKASGAAKEFKLNRADIKIVQDIKSRQGMINTILPKIQRAKELLKKINPGGMLANMTENPYILSSIPFADVGSQEDIAEFNNLAKGIADTLGSEMAGKNFGQSMVKLMRDSKVSLADPKPTIENFFDKLESDLNHKAKVDQFLTGALAQGLHSHEAMALNPELYKTYQEINPEIDKEITPEEGESEPEFSLRSVESNALPTISPATEPANLKTENKKDGQKKKKKVSTLEKMDSIMNKAWG